MPSSTLPIPALEENDRASARPSRKDVGCFLETDQACAVLLRWDYMLARAILYAPQGVELHTTKFTVDRIGFGVGVSEHVVHRRVAQAIQAFGLSPNNYVDVAPPTLGYAWTAVSFNDGSSPVVVNVGGARLG